MAPFITGDITVSSTLTGQLISNVMYQWIRDLDDIPGATSQTYALTSADIGHLIRVRMHFTDADNNFITVTSKPAGPIEAGQASPVVFQNNNGTQPTSSPVATNMPTGVTSGNLLLSTAFVPGVNAVFSISAGWAIIDQVNDAAFSAAYAYRVATGSSDAPTWSWTGGGQANTNVFRYTGNSTTTPIGNHSVNYGNSTMMSASPITSAGGGTFNLNMLTANAQSIPLASGWSEITNYTVGPSERVSYLNVPTVGTSSGTPAVTITSAGWVAFLVELRSQ
jgi:hypothetical protein